MTLTLGPVMSHDQKSHVEPHFKYPDLMNAVVPLALHEHQWQQHHVTKMVMLHLILVILTQGMQWCYSQCCPWHVMQTLATVLSH